MYIRHNPAIAQPIMDKLLSELGSHWSECSYGNDCVASISREIPNPKYDDFMEIFVPNSTRCDASNEEFNTYLVKCGDGEEPIFCKTLADTLELVKQFESTI